MGLGNLFGKVKDSMMSAGSAGAQAAQNNNTQQSQQSALAQTNSIKSSFSDRPRTNDSLINALFDIGEAILQYPRTNNGYTPSTSEVPSAKTINNRATQSKYGAYNPTTDQWSNMPSAPKVPSAEAIGEKATNVGNRRGWLKTPRNYMWGLRALEDLGWIDVDDLEETTKARQTEERNKSIDKQIAKAEKQGFSVNMPKDWDPESNSWVTDYNKFIENPDDYEFRLSDKGAQAWESENEGWELAPDPSGSGLVPVQVDQQNADDSNPYGGYFDYYRDWAMSQSGLDNATMNMLSGSGRAVKRLGEATTGTSDVFIGPDGRVYDRSEATPYNDADFAAAAIDKEIHDMASDEETARLLSSLGIDPLSYDYGDGALYWKLWDMDESELTDSQRHARNSLIFNTMVNLHNKYGAYPFMDEWGDPSEWWKYFNDTYIPERINAWYGGYNLGDWTGDYNSITPYGFYDYSGWLDTMNGLNPQLYQRDDLTDEQEWAIKNPLFTPGKGWDNTVFQQIENEGNLGDYANDLWLLDVMTRSENTGLTLDDTNRLMHKVAPVDISSDAIYELSDEVPFVPVNNHIQDYPFYTNPFTYQPTQGVDMSNGLDASEAYKLYTEGLVPEYLITAAGSKFQNKDSNQRYTVQRNDRSER